MWRTTIRRSAEAITLLAALLLHGGCSKTPEKLYPVSGVVRVGGRPMDSGTVQFEMIDVGKSGKRYTSAGVIGEDGSYTLRTFDEDGAPAGKHRVWVVPNFAKLPDEIGMGVGQMSPVPQKYMLPTTTDLEFEVQAGDNQIDIDVPAE